MLIITCLLTGEKANCFFSQVGISVKSAISFCETAKASRRKRFAYYTAARVRLAIVIGQAVFSETKAPCKTGLAVCTETTL